MTFNDLITISIWGLAWMIAGTVAALIIGRVIARRPTHRMTRATRQRSIQLKEAPTLTTPTVVDIDDAATLDRAADLIEVSGIADGAWWNGARDYEPGVQVDVFGAVAVALGVTHAADMQALGSDGEQPLHPALVALLLYLHSTGEVEIGEQGVEQLYAWSDDAPSEEHIVGTLRAVAVALRTEVAR